MKALIIFFLVLFISVSSCRADKNDMIMHNAQYEVDIDILKKEYNVPVSSYFKSVKPIFLETKENCLLQSIGGIQVTDDYIFILDKKYKRLYCFSKEGKFVRRIGNLGSGPGEFSNISDFTIDSNGTIYTVDPYGNKIHSYTLSGKHISSFQLKKIEGYLGHIQVVGDFLYLDFEAEKKTSKADIPLLLKVDKNSGEIVNKYLSVYKHNLGFQFITGKDGSFFYSKNSNKPCYAPIYSSIIFSLDNGVEPYFRINSKRLLQKKDLEKLDFSHSQVKMKIDEIHKIKSIKNFIEVENYIFCQYFDDPSSGSDILLYNKKSGEASLYDAFVDDYFYKTTDRALMPHFGCSDKKGIYAFTHVQEMPIFIESYKSGDIKFELDKEQHNQINKFLEEMNPPLFYYELKE